MILLPNWKRVLAYAWSVRLAVLSAFLAACEVGLPLLVDAMPRSVFAALSMLAAAGAGIARIVPQQKIDRRTKPRRPNDPEMEDYE